MPAQKAAFMAPDYQVAPGFNLVIRNMATMDVIGAKRRHKARVRSEPCIFNPELHTLKCL
jgi:hypothetical protein